MRTWLMILSIFITFEMISTIRLGLDGILQDRTNPAKLLIDRLQHLCYSPSNLALFIKKFNGLIFELYWRAQKTSFVSSSWGQRFVIRTKTSSVLPATKKSTLFLWSWELWSLILTNFVDAFAHLEKEDVNRYCKKIYTHTRLVTNSSNSMAFDENPK